MQTNTSKVKQDVFLGWKPEQNRVIWILCAPKSRAGGAVTFPQFCVNSRRLVYPDAIAAWPPSWRDQNRLPEIPPQTENVLSWLICLTPLTYGKSRDFVTLTVGWGSQGQLQVLPPHPPAPLAWQCEGHYWKRLAAHCIVWPSTLATTSSKL